MKKIVLLLLIVFAALSAAAQEHLSFKGIPIEGSMASFCQKLQAKGFSKLNSDKNITLFAGDFTGRQATVGVVASDDGKNVHSVVVIFDSSSEWKKLVDTYDYYKELYTLKYGNPSVSVENNPSHYDSNIMLMHELEQGTVTYGSCWDAIGGEIELSIEKSLSYGKGMVLIKYSDAQNVDAKIQSDLDEI